jgi:hypothetical protein
MADNPLESEALLKTEDTVVSDRRAFFKRSAMVGIPVILATVRPRTAWAGGSTTTAWSTTNHRGCKFSTGASGCNAHSRGYDRQGKKHQ